MARSSPTSRHRLDRRLVDTGAMDPASSGDKVRVSYPAGPAGAKVVLEIRTGSAAFNPFRLRELAAFNCP